MDRETAFKAAANWWSEKLRPEERHSNSANDSQNLLAMLMADMLVVPVSEDKLNKFRRELEEELHEELLDGECSVYIGCDYEPCRTLAYAANQAGIKLTNFPHKTCMYIRKHGEENYTVEVSSDYGVTWAYVKPCE